MNTYVKLLKVLALISIVIVFIGSYIVVSKYFTLAPIESPTTINYKEPIVRENNQIFLPMPKLKSNVSLEEALAMRRSIREYLNKPLTIEDLSQILWAAQGINEVKWGLRTAPSAGATYPLEIYVVIKENGVTGVRAGIYHYNILNHSLEPVKEGDYSDELAKAALNQPWVKAASVNIVITAIYERTTLRYGDRGYRYVHIEVGHVGQNIYLQAASLGLGTVAIGAFYDEEIRKIIGAPENQHPLYIMPIGVPKKRYRLVFEELVEFYYKHRET